MKKLPSLDEALGDKPGGLVIEVEGPSKNEAAIDAAHRFLNAIEKKDAQALVDAYQLLSDACASYGDDEEKDEE